MALDVLPNEILENIFLYIDFDTSVVCVDAPRRMSQILALLQESRKFNTAVLKTIHYRVEDSWGRPKFTFKSLVYVSTMPRSKSKENIQYHQGRKSDEKAPSSTLRSVNPPNLDPRMKTKQPPSRPGTREESPHRLRERSPIRDLLRS
jgi:hypothetical protein